jgi:hypothetical protein
MNTEMSCSFSLKVLVGVEAGSKTFVAVGVFLAGAEEVAAGAVHAIKSHTAKHTEKTVQMLYNDFLNILLLLCRGPGHKYLARQTSM